MKRLLALVGLLALAGCAEVQPLTAPGPLGSRQAETPLGWARLADLSNTLNSSSSSSWAYLQCAELAAKQGDHGAEVLCLESAYRLIGGQRWDQEAQRAKLAHRLEAIKLAQGRKGAAASYAVIAAVSEAYLDGGQASDDLKAYKAAQARIAAAKAAQQKAEDEASAAFMSGIMTNAFSAGMGLTSNEAATMGIFQSEMKYLEQDSAISEAGKGLGDAEALLGKSSGQAAEARASHLLAAALASTDDPVPYARGAQAALRKSGLGGKKGPIADFIALAPPTRSRSEKRDFVQAFQAAEKALWRADLEGKPLALAPVQGEDLGGAWNKPQTYSRTAFIMQGFSEGPYKRTLSFDSTSAGKSLKVPVTMTAEVKSTLGFELGAEILPYPGGGFHFLNVASVQLGQLSFPGALTATGSSWGIADRLGLGYYQPLVQSDMLGFAIDANTLLFKLGESNVRWGSNGYDVFDFAILGLELEASLRLLHVVRLGVAMPLAAPFGTDDKRDAGGLRFTAGLAFGFGLEPPAKRLAAAEAGSYVPDAEPVSGGKVTRVKEAKAAKPEEAKPQPTAQPTPATKAKVDDEKAKLAKEKELLRKERELLEREKALLEREKSAQ